MLRLSKLLRCTALPKHIATRSGLPNWDRPDPPPSATVPDDHEFTDEQIVFYFPDRNMPEYVLSQPEVYEGDTVLQSIPMFLKGWGFVFAIAGVIGIANWVLNPPKSFIHAPQQYVEKYENNKKMTQEKQWLKWASLNPLGIVVNNDVYPDYKPDMCTTNTLQQFDERYKKNDKINKEVKAYLEGVKQRATEKVNGKGHGGHGHKEDHKH